MESRSGSRRTRTCAARDDVHSKSVLMRMQAAISSVHSAAASPSETDWSQIVALYDLLQRIEPSPIVALNRAVAVAMRRDGPAAGLALIDSILQEGTLNDYHLAHAARADMCRRQGMNAEARIS